MKEIVLKAMGLAISKAVAIVEVIKVGAIDCTPYPFLISHTPFLIFMESGF